MYILKIGDKVDYLCMYDMNAKKNSIKKYQFKKLISV